MKQNVFILLLGMALSQGSVAKTPASIKSVISASFSNVSSIEAKQIILSKKQFEKITSRAKAPVRTKVYRYYDIKSKSKRLGYAVLIARKVRSKKATVLYAFDNFGTLKFTEIKAFTEPPENIPSTTWMGQLQNKSDSTKLTVGKDIPTISGSTLSARSITEGARVARAIYEIILK